MDATTSTMNILTMVALSLFTIYWYFRNRYKYWERRNLPFLEPIIPFGNLKEVWFNKTIHFGEYFGHAYLAFKQLGVKHGGIFALDKPIYIPVDLNIIKHLLISDAENFLDHGFYNNVEEDPLTGHIFNMDGSRWKFLRTKITQAYTTAKLKKMFLTVIELSNELVDFLEKGSKSSDGIEIKSEMRKFTTDIIASCGFGMDTKIMRGENPEILKQIHYFVVGQWTLYKSMVMLFIPKSILKIFKYKVFPEKNTKFVTDMFTDFKNYRKKNDIQRDDIADIILKLNDTNVVHKNHNGETMEPLTDNEYFAQMWVFLCASTDTTASTVSFVLYELSQNLECQKKLRDEINTVLEKYDGKMCYETLKEMSYLEYVTDEALRLYPVFPIIPRICKSDYKVPGTEFVLEKDSFIMISNYGLQRDPEYYPEPSKFDPERFTPENKAKRPFVAYIPFGDGPRICPAKLFGLLQIKVAVAMIIKNFEVSLGNKTTPGFDLDKWELMLRKTGDIWINLKKINHN